MDLWIRSTAKTNLLKVRFLTIMNGDNFYKKNQWEYEGYTICNCNKFGEYELLGTYKTKERALEVLDEIQNILKPQKIIKTIDNTVKMKNAIHIVNPTYETITQFEIYVYEMPQE